MNKEEAKALVKNLINAAYDAAARPSPEARARQEYKEDELVHALTGSEAESPVSIKRKDADRLMYLYDLASEATEGESKYVGSGPFIARQREQMRRYILEALIADTRPTPDGLR